MSTYKRVPKPIQKPNDDHNRWLLRRVYDRVNRDNEHFMGCIVGREGSGKSYTAIKIANNIDPTFNADRIIFDVSELLKVLRDGDHEPGNFYVLDEAGVQFGRRTWQDRAQVLANQALQLIRSHNLGLIFTLPRLSELDSQTEGRLQAVIEIVDKIPDDHVTVKWKFLDPDRVDSNGNILKKYPRRRQNGLLKRVTRNKFAPPHDEGLIEAYEENKAAFQERVYDDTIDKLEGKDGEDEEDDGMTLQEIATDIESNGMEPFISHHGNTGKPYVDKGLVRAEYELSHADARTVKTILEKENNLDEYA